MLARAVTPTNEAEPVRRLLEFAYLSFSTLLKPVIVILLASIDEAPVLPCVAIPTLTLAVVLTLISKPAPEPAASARL